MTSLTLVRAWFKVYESGRRRAVQEGRRNVHAMANGDCLGACEEDLVARMGMVEVAYNPFRNETFVERATGRPVEAALMLMLTRDGKVFACQPRTKSDA